MEFRLFDLLESFYVRQRCSSPWVESVYAARVERDMVREISVATRLVFACYCQNRSEIRGAIVASYALYAVGYALSIWGNPWWMALVRRCFSLQGLAFFTIGMYLRMYPLDIKIKARWLVVLFMAGVMLMVVKARCFGNMVLFQGLTTLIIPLILLPIWALIPDRPWPRFLVSTSFGVYLVHMFFVRVAQHFATGWLQTLVGFVLGYLLIVVCSVFFVLAIKRLVPRLEMLAFGGR